MITFHECAHESMNFENQNKMKTGVKIQTGIRSRSRPGLETRPKEAKGAARKLRIEFHNEAYCPMAKASWLQTEKEVRNPYYGKSMLDWRTLKN